MKKLILSPVGMGVIGLALGVLSRLMDIYTDNLGDVFSELAVWILIGTLISVSCETVKQAMTAIAPFCYGMLFSYYLTERLMGDIFPRVYIIGWAVFAFFSPVFAGLVWYSREKGLFPGLIRAGVVACALLSSVLLYGGIGIEDIVIDIWLVYLLFIKRSERVA